MKRIWTSTLAVSLFVLPACKGGASADAVKLIPDGAEAIAGINIQSVTGSDVWKTYSEKIPEEGLQEFEKTLEGCELSMDGLDAIVIGLSQTQDYSVVIAGKGIGEPDNATCLVNEMKKRNGETDEVEVTKVDGHEVIEASDGRMYLVNKNMVALASKGWQDEVGELIDGKGTPAIENSKKDLYKKADHKAAVWFLAEVPSAMLGDAKEVAEKASTVSSIVGKVDLSNGVAIDLIAGYADGDSATAAATELQALVDQYGPLAGEELGGVVKSVKIEADGSDLNLAVSASMSDLETAASLVPGMGG